LRHNCIGQGDWGGRGGGGGSGEDESGERGLGEVDNLVILARGGGGGGGGGGGDGRGGGGGSPSFSQEDVDLLGHVNITLDLIMLQWHSNADSTVESAAVELETGGV